MKEKIKYLICPKCENSFYINARFADKGHTWLCPKCRHNFTEEESRNDKNVKVSKK
jgi:predicted nucleic-acid-binding Zn-ribbon protein